MPCMKYASPATFAHLVSLMLEMQQGLCGLPLHSRLYNAADPGGDLRSSYDGKLYNFLLTSHFLVLKILTSLRRCDV
jgi:hypothetical protein